jgi:hypothetical protein
MGGILDVDFGSRTELPTTRHRPKSEINHKGLLHTEIGGYEEVDEA